MTSKKKIESTGEEIVENDELDKKDTQEENNKEEMKCMIQMKRLKSWVNLEEKRRR